MDMRLFLFWCGYTRMSWPWQPVASSSLWVTGTYCVPGISKLLLTSLLALSSGAQIALCLAFAVHDAGLTLPAQLIAISPGISLTPNPDMYRIAPYDLVLTPEFCFKAVRLWAGVSIPPTPESAAHPGLIRIPPSIVANPHINPMAGDLTILAKAGTKFILVSGEWDVLHADIVPFAEKAEEAGVEMTFITGEHQFHCFPIAIDVAPECADASRAIVSQVIANGGERYVQR